MVKIFLSHSSQDVVPADSLIKLIRKGILVPASAIRCTSVPGYKLPGGAKTDNQLREELLAAPVFIGLITEASLSSTYVLFELGARWGADKELIPLLAPAISPKVLKGPISGIHAFSCSSSEDLHTLIAQIGKVLGMDSEPPAAYQHELEMVTQLSPEAWGIGHRPPERKIDLYFEIKEASTYLAQSEQGTQSKWVQIVTESATDAPLVNCEARLISVERLGEDGNATAVVLAEPLFCTWSNIPETENRRMTIPGKVPQAANIFAVIKHSTELFPMTSPVQYGFRDEIQKPGRYRLKVALSAQGCLTEIRTPLFDWGGSYDSIAITRE